MEKKRNSTTKMRLTCAIIFILFTYLYLSCYQEDVLAVAQHILSGGLTTYNYVLFPIITTTTLYLLQLGVYWITRVKKSFHALTYFPSLLVLAFITDVPCYIDHAHSIGAWAWVAPLLLVAYGFLIWVIRQLEPYEPELHSNQWLSKWTWWNLLQMVTMILLVVLVANGDQLFHERMKMERLMQEGKYEEALTVGKNTCQTDSSLTMLRIACLQKTGKLGDKLFTYPLVGGSKAMLPDSVTVKSLMWRCPRWMRPDGKGKYRYKLPNDYKLCAFLLDKNLDAFVKEVQKYYDITKPTLPVHYREALLLYTHRRANPMFVYRNPVMEADFQDFQALEAKNANPMEKMTALRDMYGNTYWYYFQFVNN